MTIGDAQKQLMPSSFYGQSGWYMFPQTGVDSWYMRRTADQIFVSPNADFSAPVYTALNDVDGYLKVQDQMLNQSRPI